MSVGSIEGIRTGRPAVAGRSLSLQWVVVTFMLVEVALLVVSAALPTWYLAALGLHPYNRYDGGGFPLQLDAAVLAVALYLVAARLWRIYSLSRLLDAKPSIRRLFVVSVVTFSSLIAIAAATKTTQTYSRLWFFSWASSAIILIVAFRICGLAWLQRKLQSGACVFRALTVGIAVPAMSAEQLLLRTGNRARAIRSSTLSQVADVAALADLIRTDDVDQIYITAPWAMIPELACGLSELRSLAADIFLCCDDRRLGSEIVDVRQFGQGLALQTAARPIGGWGHIAKRCEDIVVALLALIAAAPVMILAALAIVVESRGPVLFRQHRKGFNGAVFTLLKFRSMYDQHADLHAAKQTCRDDARVTRVGRFIRRWSIDELPQLFNVLGGSMSIVGPRPHALSTSAEGRKLENTVDYYASRHRVKPGMTGWAQVNGLRGEINSVNKLQARVDCDISYIETWSFWLDIKIIALTFHEIFLTRNAY